MATDDLSRREMLRMLGLGSGLLLIRCRAEGYSGETLGDLPEWAYLVDIDKCIGCCSCMRACRAENDVPEGSLRTWIERYRITEDGEVSVDAATSGDYVFDPKEGDVARSFFVPKLCNHCEKSPCSQVCPVGASYRTRDGAVLVDPEQCIGCGYCVQACPYGTRFINPVNHVADKCTLCYHRISKGDGTAPWRPACVEACPTEARIFGNLKDPESTISQLMRQRPHQVLSPELGTHPKVHYIGLDKEVK